MIRDLKYPEDARKVLDALHHGLQYDAAVSILGSTCSQLKIEGDHPDFSTGFRIGGREADLAVRREAPGLLSRFALSQMVSRFEFFAQNLLLQRRVLEHLRGPGVKMTPAAFWAILKAVQKESRNGPVKMCEEMVIASPSSDLKGRMAWLKGLYKVRNCLMHRLGHVTLVDVKPDGVALEQVQDTDRLRAVWLRPKVSIGGVVIESFPHHSPMGGQMEVKFEDYDREWKIGDVIEITPLDCQCIGMSLSLLGNRVIHDFETEMNVVLGIK